MQARTDTHTQSLKEYVYGKTARYKYMIQGNQETGKGGTASHDVK